MAVASPAGAGSDGKFTFNASGDEIVGGGDEEGEGRFTLRLYPEKEVVCLKGKWKRIEGDVTAIHIHKAPEGQNGPHQIDIFNDETFRGKWNRIEFCIQAKVPAHNAANPDADPEEIIEEIMDDPEGFYLNIHSTEFPGGAIRGQLDEWWSAVRKPGVLVGVHRQGTSPGRQPTNRSVVCR